ncbi:signal peptidase II, partial [bacterium]|nr:signal peptidase II [bacterium]
METHHDSIGCSVKSFLKYFLSSWMFPSTLVVVVILDQWSKLAVRASLGLGERVTAIDGFLNIVYTTNRGIAFGILSGNRSQYKPLLLSIGAVVAVIVFTGFAAKYGGRKRYVAFAVAMLIGGTIGNLIDRLSYGAVIDFV